MDEEMAEVLREVRKTADELQDMYREIISFTGFNADATRVTIDANRDFNLQDNIPGLMDRMEKCRRQLEHCYNVIDEMEYVSASSASVLKEMAVMLETFQEKPNKISARVEYFRSNISSVATWAIDTQAQPLTLDKFYVYSPDVETPGVGGSGWEQLVYRAKMFFNSFVADTVSVAGVEETREWGAVLRVRGADLVDGTPILDIKPYLPYADCRPEASGGFASAPAGETLAVDFPPELLERIPPERREALRSVLALDPRPRYQEDPGRVYGFGFAGLEVRFTVEFHCLATETAAVPAVTNAQLVEARSAGEGQRPSVVLRMPAPGDALWDIAKAHGTTMEQILQANELEEETLPTGRMLLIPSTR